MSPDKFVNSGFKATLELEVPVPGFGFKKHRIPVTESPELCKVVADIASMELERQSLELSDNIESDLEAMAILLTASNPHPEFSCRISTMTELQTLYQDKVVEQCWIQLEQALPQDVVFKGPLSDVLDKNRPLLWIQCANTKQINVYWITSTLAQQLAGVDGQKMPFIIENELVIKVSNETLQNAAKPLLGVAKKQLAENGYYIFRDLFSHPVATAIDDYFAQLFKYGYHEDSDEYVPTRQSIYREPIAELYHALITPLTSHILNETVINAHSFLASYKADSMLEKHTDRSQCQWNWSIQLGSKSKAGKPWPIYIEHEGKTHEALLGFGDALLFRGQDNPHWRDKLQNSERETVLLTHFVCEDFTGSLD
jgi:hypothetical protein